ncbi:MAG: S8 family serine peptidase, partial [Planctomycetales bacterium]|nr:S8 family serine peptidase [Planctomycetales bacterium]
MSRRQRKQFGFEPLEDRRVMAANLISGDIPTGSGLEDVVIQYEQYDSSTALGQLQILSNELYWIQLAQPLETPTYETNALPTDPLFSQQWHLINTGQQVGNPDYQPIYGVPGEDLNVAEAWLKGYTGNGVVVAVIDSGVQIDHPDLINNIHPTLAFDGTVANGVTPDPTPIPATVIQDPVTGQYIEIFNGNSHGTNVAGIIAAEANNGIGGSGISPEALIVPMKLITGGQEFPQRYAQAFRYAINDIDITSNSWGPALERGIVGPDLASYLAIRDSIFFGRDGLGQIHVFSSGNSAGPSFNIGFDGIGPYSSAGYNGWVNTRYTIGVTGVDHDGFYNNVDGT